MLDPVHNIFVVQCIHGRKQPVQKEYLINLRTRKPQVTNISHRTAQQANLRIAIKTGRGLFIPKVSECKGFVVRTKRTEVV